jgi:hypothetical protein
MCCVALDSRKLFDKYNEWSAYGRLLPGALEQQPDADDLRSALFRTQPVEWNRLPQLQVGLRGHRPAPSQCQSSLLTWVRTSSGRM